LSTASIAKKVARAIQHAANAELTVVASRNKERARLWAEQNGCVKAVGSYEELLSDPAVDAVYLPLPPSMHHEWTIRAARAGKHVLCEKPLAASTVQAREMAAACAENGVQLMDGVMWVHHDRAEEFLRRAPEIGRLRRVTSAFTFCWDEVPADDFRLNPDLGGGSLGDLGWYCVRATNFFFQSRPLRVFADARYHQGVDMNLSAMLWYDDERTASFDCGFDTAPRQWFEVAGVSGTIVCDDFVLPKSEEKSRFWLHTADGTAQTFELHDIVQEVRMIEKFSGIVQSKELETRWPDEAVETMLVCEALAESARKGRVVELGDRE
ncbi:MAG: Gfo/Idh/MocA family protein, partial [Planctomycetia bacterium]